MTFHLVAKKVTKEIVVKLYFFFFVSFPFLVFTYVTYLGGILISAELLLE